MTKNIKTPVQLAQSTIIELFEENKNLLIDLTLMSNPITIKFDTDKYNISNDNRFLHKQWDRVFSITRKKESLKVKLVTNFIVKDVKECTLIYNDKSRKNNQKQYIVTLQNINGNEEKDITIANNTKSDYKQFQNLLDSSSNNFYINMSDIVFGTLLKSVFAKFNRYVWLCV